MLNFVEIDVRPPNITLLFAFRLVWDWKDAASDDIWDISGYPENFTAFLL